MAATTEDLNQCPFKLDFKNPLKTLHNLQLCSMFQKNTKCKVPDSTEWEINVKVLQQIKKNA